MSVTIDGGTGSVALTATASGASLGTTLIVPAGSAGAPSVVATGDTNTGVFFPAADTVALATGGSERVRVDSSGAVLGGNTSSIGSLPLRFQSKGAAGGGSPGAGYSVISGNDEVAGHIVLASSAENSINISVDPQNLRASSSLQFSVDGTERGRFNSTGAFVLQGGTTTANGVGITFPATQSASSDANTLDDYEEGTWTPAVSFSGGNGDTGYTVRYGSYTKVGRIVTCTAYIWFSESTASGNLSVTGLPFTSVGGGTYGYNWYGIVGSNSLTGYTNYFLQVNGGFGGGTTTAAVLGNSGTQLTNANTGANTVFVFSVTYEAA